MPGLTGKLVIEDVSAFQTVKTSLSQPSALSVSLVAKKSAVLRAYVSASGEVEGRELTATFKLTNRDGVQELPSTAIARALTDRAASGIATVQVPAEALQTDTTLSLMFRDSLTGELLATWPSGNAEAALRATELRGVLEVVLVPIRYDADGSSRLPDTSAAAIAAYRAGLMALYPTADVRLSVRRPLPFAAVVSRSGAGWGEVLSAIAQARGTDRPADGAYYMGLVNPAVNNAMYCSSSCVAGLSTVVTRPEQSQGRTSIVVGFGGEGTTDSMAHELGHAHGREHAPCGVTNPDDSFPYADGSVGVWGYDSRTRTLLAPSTTKDFMGYCNPTWISDYNYAALATRMEAIERRRTLRLATAKRESSELQSVDIVMLQPNGSFSRTGTTEIPSDQLTAMVLARGAHGTKRLQASSFNLSEGQARLVYVAKLPPTISSLQFD